MFCNHVEFGTVEAAIEFLSSAGSEDDPVILNQLNSWTRQLMSSELVVDGIGSRCADTADELAGYLERFVKTVSAPEGEQAVPSLWPIVRIVRYNMVSALLDIY